ncbi:white collar 2 type of transcription factor [Basidiobolus ranarum]|uniref:White collar 2 type of transcription factor n=1 Tax=Basidiobolus ranarum TaxID=34480 RepID=A0ABR2W0S1_9FUNG
MSSEKCVYPISSTHLLEFTKRKNWSHRIIGQLHDFHYVLTTSGKLIYCSPSCLELTGYSAHELLGKDIVEFIHVDDIDPFVSYLKEALTKGDFRFFYRFKCKNSTYTILEVSGHPYFQNGSASAKCFFNQARPYPARATSMLDALLQLKLENEILSQSVEELRSELQDHEIDPFDGNRGPTEWNEVDSGVQAGDESFNDEPRNTLDLRGGMGSRRSSVNTDETRSTPNSNVQPNLAPDATKKRKHKAFDDIERVCTECGTTDAPEWRKGPMGPKTLCNACGLRWSKKSKKESTNYELLRNIIR